MPCLSRQESVGVAGERYPGSAFDPAIPKTETSLTVLARAYLRTCPRAWSRDWIETTDLVTIDQKAFLVCVARVDGAIAHVGFKILPKTAERVLRLH